MSESGFDNLYNQLNTYKRKFHLNSLIRGVILFITANASFYFILSTLEYYFRFSTLSRALFLFSFILLVITTFGYFITIPILRIVNLAKGLSNEDAAKQIGQAFPEISDKLTNALQLLKLDPSNSDLILASLQQRTNELKWYKFPKAINFGENRKFFKYLFGPVFLILLVSFFIPDLFSVSNERIINYHKQYVPEAPFQISFLNKELRSFKNEDYELQIKFDGVNLPEEAYILNSNRRLRLKKIESDIYTFKWRKIQKDEVFSIEASGFEKGPYTLAVSPRPELQSFAVKIEYPKYTDLKNETLKNIGDFSAPEGSKIIWSINTQDADSALLEFDDTETVSSEIKNNYYTYSKNLIKSFDYSISLKSSKNYKRKLLEYNVVAIPDKFPKLEVKQVYDSSLFNYVLLGGQIQDDYGFSKFILSYKIIEENIHPKSSGTIPLEFSKQINDQNFVFNWNIDSIGLAAGQKIEYYLQISDNDGFNGPKSTKSQVYSIEIPSIKELRESNAKSSKSIQNQLNEVQKETQELNKELKELMDESKAKKSLEWQDKNKIEQALKKHESLKEKLNEINKEFEKNLESKERFEKQDDDIKQKTESLKKLMNELLDEETKRLLEELQKLLENKSDNNQMQNKLEQLEDKTFDLEKELDRALEMFKQLQFEEKLENAIEDLEKLAEKQEELSEQTKDKSLKNKDLEEKQKALNEEFKEISKDLDEIKELDESMENPNDFESPETDKQDIEKSMQESSDEISKDKNKKASETQKKSSEKMKKMSKEMSNFMMDMQSQGMTEDMNDLREILENLITLSFDQEKLMKEFKRVNQSDPRYVELGQEQLKLKDDAKIIQDSLFSLAKRVFQIESFVTREVNKMNDNIEDALEAIKERKNGLASGKQQFAMTSINNLALMLNDVLKQMQEQMAQQMQGEQMCSKPKPGGKPSMSQLQQKLNEQIRQLKKSGKEGRALSEELAELAREQESLRKMMEDLSSGDGQLDKNAQQKLKDLEKIMEDSENDLVHKRLTQELLDRQEQILTRLLESEKAAREQKMDPKRESQTANKKDRDAPPDLQKYFEEKERQTELLKSISPNLNNYYRDRVNDYFEKIYE